jgi:hypothetical protein
LIVTVEGPTGTASGTGDDSSDDAGPGPGETGAEAGIGPGGEDSAMTDQEDRNLPHADRQVPEAAHASSSPDEESAVVTRVASAIEDAVGAAVHATTRRWDERPGARVRRLRRRGREPLPYLYDVHPEARQANPRELGVMLIDVDDVAGTAVGGATQRGGDSLPLKPFRGANWRARWQRLKSASDRLAILPPIDVVRYAGRYWVLDGHNRVALALYNGQAQIDANVVELIPPGGSLTVRPASLATTLQESTDLRSAVSRRSVADPVAPEAGVPELGGPPGDHVGRHRHDAGTGEP